MTGIGENTLAQPVKPPLRERCACLAKLVKNRLTLTPSRESMLRLTCASLMKTEGQWSQQRVFSEASAAEGFAEPADRPAPTEGRRRALGRRAGEIVDEIVERRGLKKE